MIRLCLIVSRRIIELHVLCVPVCMNLKGASSSGELLYVRVGEYTGE